MMVSQEEWSKVCANKCIYKSKSDDASYAAPVAKKNPGCEVASFLISL